MVPLYSTLSFFHLALEPAWACRSACRLRYEPPRRSDHIGFRVVVVERR